MAGSYCEGDRMSDPTEELCSLCHVRYSTPPCNHLQDISYGRIIIDRATWEGLVNDRHKLYERDKMGNSYSRSGRNFSRRTAPSGNSGGGICGLLVLTFIAGSSFSFWVYSTLQIFT